MPGIEKAKSGLKPKEGDTSPIGRKLRTTGGFTLIEIAVVLAIIGMVMVLVMPRLPSSDGEDLKISARSLAATIRYIQERAAAGRTAYHLHFEPGTEKFYVREAMSDGSEREPADPLLQKRLVRPGVQVADVIIPRLGRVSDGQLRLDIGIGGLRDLAVIHLRSPNGVFWTVMAFPSNGKVKVYEGNLETPP